jgi:hypothetical protein
MRTWALRIAAVLVAGAAATAIAAATKPIKDRSGTCQADVPEAWVVGALPGSATSPDKAFLIIISSPSMIDSFDELKSMAPSIYTENKVVKSTAKEFEMEGKDQNGKPDIYRAVPAAGGKFCIATINFPDGKAAEARPIVETLR